MGYSICVQVKLTSANTILLDFLTETCHQGFKFRCRFCSVGHWIFLRDHRQNISLFICALISAVVSKSRSIS
jgi:hypothetical protein